MDFLENLEEGFETILKEKLEFISSCLDENGDILPEKVTEYYKTIGFVEGVGYILNAFEIIDFKKTYNI